MASKILNTFETGVTVTISMASVANGAGRISTQIDNTTTRARDVQVAVQITSGGVAPTAGAPYKVYLMRASGMATSLLDDGYGTSDAAASVEPLQGECLGFITCSATTAAPFRRNFIARDVGPKYSILIWNASGQTVSTTAGDHIVQVVPLNWEAQ